MPICRFREGVSRVLADPSVGSVKDAVGRGGQMWLVAAVLTAALAGLGGCAGAGGPVSTAGARDLVTASDETDLAKRARIRLELASAYFAQGQAATALDEVKRALAIDPDNVGAYNLRGLIYASLGEVGYAEESFRRALSLKTDDGES